MHRRDERPSAALVSLAATSFRPAVWPLMSARLRAGNRTCIPLKAATARPVQHQPADRSPPQHDMGEAT